MIRAIIESDADSACKIYNYYIKNSVATFEEEEYDKEKFSFRIKEVTKNYPWLVYEDEGMIAGYAYATKWKDRNSYRFTVESTVYLREEYFRKGIGKLLMESLIKNLTQNKFHKILAGITLPNDRSIALHEGLGFTKCGQLHEVGFKFGRWVDVGYWEKLI